MVSYNTFTLAYQGCPATECCHNNHNLDVRMFALMPSCVHKHCHTNPLGLAHESLQAEFWAAWCNTWCLIESTPKGV